MGNVMHGRDWQVSDESICELRHVMDTYNFAVEVHNRAVVFIQTTVPNKELVMLSKRNIARMLEIPFSTFAELTLVHRHVFKDLNDLTSKAEQARKRLLLLHYDPAMKKLQDITIG